MHTKSALLYHKCRNTLTLMLTGRILSYPDIPEAQEDCLRVLFPEGHRLFPHKRNFLPNALESGTDVPLRLLPPISPKLSSNVRANRYFRHISSGFECSFSRMNCTRSQRSCAICAAEPQHSI